MRRLRIFLHGLFPAVAAWITGAVHAAGEVPYPGPMRAVVLRVVDADTFRARVMVWPAVEILATIRVRVVDAPEGGRRARCAAERRLARGATAFVRRLLPRGTVVRIRNVRPGKYAGRVIADVDVSGVRGGPASLARLLIAKGLGRPYRGHRRHGWCSMP
jgi:endonuclease YncB( thermonuclease family)